MIYEYPEEFIIPVVYADDLKEKSIYRHEEREELRDWKLIILDDELLGHKMFQGNTEVLSNENEGMKHFNMDEDSFPSLYKEDMMNDNTVEESLEDEKVKRILSDIDNDYANSETLHIHSEH